MRKFLLILACCAAFYVLLFQVFRILTDVGELEKSFPKVVYDAKTKKSQIEIGKNPPPGWVNFGAISSKAVAAIVLSEDWAFYQHNGFDWEQIWDAAQKNLETGKFARGGSTITQQVVKNVYLSNRKTLTRKLQEAILAIRVERQLTKKRILEIYLNIAEFGEGIYGIGPASRYYFGKHPSELNAKEGAFLAMLLPSPKKYSISFRKKELTPYAASIVRSVMGKLLATKRISQEEYDSLIATPLSFEARVAVVPTEAPLDEQEVDADSGEAGEPSE
jgi:monofunctional biosynthetic peptidoglycan transglycosylase